MSPLMAAAILTEALRRDYGTRPALQDVNLEVREGEVFGILGPNGVELDRGVSRWPNLAPGETATIELDGSRAYSDAWVRVRFEAP